MFAITAGATLGGIPAAAVAVPLVAVLSRVAAYLARLRRTDDDEETAVAAEPDAPVADSATQELHTEQADADSRVHP